MERDRVSMRNAYQEKMSAGHEAFREKNFGKLAQKLFEQGEIAEDMFQQERTDEWDLKTYGAYNAAGGMFEALGDFTTASEAYKKALVSCERIANARSIEWQKNVNHLKSLIHRVTEYPGK